MPVTPIVAQQIAEAKRLGQVLLSEIDALHAGTSSVYHLEMAENMLSRIGAKLSDVKMNQQLVQNTKLDPEGGDAWQYERPR